MAATFLSNEGYIVVSTSHFVANGVEYVTGPFNQVTTGKNGVALDFQVEASGLTPNVEYRVQVIRIQDTRHRLFPLAQTDPSYPNDWTPQDDTTDEYGATRYKWENLITDAQGNLSETLLDTFKTTFAGYGAVSEEHLGRDINDPSAGWVWANKISPYPIDTNYGLEERRLADFPQDIITEKDGRDLNLVCVKYQTTYTLRLRDRFNQTIKVIDIVVDNVKCVDTLLDEAISGVIYPHLMTIPVDLSIDADENQEWTPVVDQACAVVTPSKPFVYSEAMRRDFATAPADNLQIHTLEIYCVEDPQQESYFLCNDLQDHTLTTEKVRRGCSKLQTLVSLYRRRTATERLRCKSQSQTSMARCSATSTASVTSGRSSSSTAHSWRTIRAHRRRRTRFRCFSPRSQPILSKSLAASRSWTFSTNRFRRSSTTSTISPTSTHEHSGLSRQAVGSVRAWS